MTHPKKRFGQHFLNDAHILESMRLVIHPTKEDCMVEIGPGQGALTQQLLPYLKALTVIEIDRELIVLLKQKFQNQDLTIHEGDVLNFDFNQLTQTPNDLRVVGNLPYNISTPLLFKLFQYHHLIKDMYFLLQKEVVDRLIAPAGSSHYNRLSVMSQHYCTNTAAFDVAPEAFSPPPKVQSTFVKMVPNKNFDPTINMNVFTEVVKMAFSQRRKTIANSLKKLISTDVLVNSGINPSCRPQELSGEQYQTLAKALMK